MSDASEYVETADRAMYNDEHTWKHCYKDDPRPNAGITCNGRYLPDDWRDADARQKFHCLDCGLRKTLCIARGDKGTLITFACPACRDTTTHAPVGVPARVLGWREQQREDE